MPIYCLDTWRGQIYWRILRLPVNPARVGLGDETYRKVGSDLLSSLHISISARYASKQYRAVKPLISFFFDITNCQMLWDGPVLLAIIILTRSLENSRFHFLYTIHSKMENQQAVNSSILDLLEPQAVACTRSSISLFGVKRTESKCSFPWRFVVSFGSHHIFGTICMKK